MSRTGVGIRVLVDGAQLDDGCMDWTKPTPGTITARNLISTPRGMLNWYATAGSVLTYTDVDDWFLYTGPTEQAAATVMTSYLDTPAMPVGTEVFGRIEYSSTGAAGNPTHISARFRTMVGIPVGPIVTIPRNTTGQAVPLSWSWVTDQAIPANGLRLYIYGSNAAGQALFAPGGWQFKVRHPSADLWAPVEEFFDGDSADTPDADYQWSAVPRQSASWAVQPERAPVMPYGLSADDGLKITWGRNDTVEQPAPSTCTFRVTDDFENQYFRNFGIGSTVDVLADARVTGGDTVGAFVDPDFETELRATTKNATATRDSRHVETGTVSAVLKPINASSAWSFQLPPSTLQPPGQNPNAWDALPHLSPGETWNVEVRLWVPEGVRATVNAVIYTGPYATAATVGATIGTVVGPVGGGWFTTEADVAPGVQLGWIGVQVEGVGSPAWRDMTDPTTWASLPDTFQWRDLTDIYVDHVGILAPAGGTTVTMLAFSGRITDMESQWDEGYVALDVTATDFLGDLGNRYVGDEPWLAEPLATRMLRVLELAQVPGELPITADIAPTLAPAQMTWEDVDHKAASGLLTDMAASVDGVLWSATHQVSGPYIRLEDPGQRPALYQLDMVGGVIVIVEVNPDDLPPEQRPLEISACDVLRDPVLWQIDVSDIATRTTVTWMDQTLNDEGQPAPTQRTLALIDQGREAQYGTRNVSVQTMVTTEALAEDVAERILARANGEWRLSGLVVADADFEVPDNTAINVLLTLLDGVRRGGMGIRVTGLPAWSPLGESAPAYVEGGTYSYVDGGWELALTVSRATGLGRNAQWDQLPPEWTWDDWSPALTWDQLRGVAAPGGVTAFALTESTNGDIDHGDD